MRRTRVVAVAAAAGSTPTRDPDKAAVAADASNDGKAAEGKADNDITAAAATLGVTADDLLTAMIAAKTSLADSPDQTRDAFIAEVAANLGRPVAQVWELLAPMFVGA